MDITPARESQVMRGIAWTMLAGACLAMFATVQQNADSCESPLGCPERFGFPLLALILVGASELMLWRLSGDNALTGFVGWASLIVCVVTAFVFQGLELGFFRTVFLILAGTALFRQLKLRRTQSAHREDHPQS
ncbi:MAG: hypothetical protein AABX89_05870 [Candidatus Thermoplasmatota archaeon]